MNPLHRILTIEDDPQVSSMLTYCLKREGYRVIECLDGLSGLKAALAERPDLVVLDLELPTLDGIKICSELRRVDFDAPILMLTGRALLGDRVAGLDAGADDYLGKPFAAPELLARIRALLRRKTRTDLAATKITLGSVCIDLATKIATRDGKPVALTKTEYSLLELLAKKMGGPVSRETILDVIWGYTRFPSTRTVDTHIWRLRKKIGDDGDCPRWIKGIPGQGYYLAAEALSITPPAANDAPANPEPPQ